MNITAKDLMHLMDTWAPKDLAESWDHPGLQVGNPEEPVKKVLIALDVTAENVDYAASHGVTMIISHHPFLFKSIHTLDLTSWRGAIIGKLITNHIVSFAAHTNLDTARGGVNDALAGALDLHDLADFVPEKTYPMMKVAAYAPFVKAKEFHYRVKERYPDMGKSFYLLDDFDDAARVGKMEFNVPSEKLDILLEEMKNICGPIHYDVYELKNGGRRESMGRIGHLPRPMTGLEALAHVKKCLGIPDLRYAGNPDRTVETVAVLGGAGSEFASLAKAKRADLYVTGDLKYHEAQDAAGMGLLIADGGHFYTERVIVPVLADRIRKAAAEKGWDLEVLEDSGAKDIFEHV